MESHRIGTDIELVLAERARRQYGILSRADLLSKNVSPQAILRRVRKGTLEEVLPRTYRLPGAPRSWEQDLMAALLWAGPNSAVSHRAAAALFELDTFPRAETELTVVTKSKPPAGLVVHRVQRLWGHDLTLFGPFTTTTVARTLLDCGGVAGISRVEFALEDALRRKITTLPALHWELRTHGGRGHPGSATLRKLLSSRPAGYTSTDSHLELKLDRVLRSAAFAPYVRQHVVQTRAGARRIDFAYVQYQLAVEADGYRWHSGRQAWEKDKRRDRSLRAAGWELVYVTDDDLRRRRREVIEDVRSALVRRGWKP